MPFGLASAPETVCIQTAFEALLEFTINYTFVNIKLILHNGLCHLYLIVSVSLQNMLFCNLKPFEFKVIKRINLLMCKKAVVLDLYVSSSLVNQIIIDNGLLSEDGEAEELQN